MLPAPALYLNLTLYSLLLLLILMLCAVGGSRAWRIGKRRCMQSLLTLLFAVERVGWAALLVGVMDHSHKRPHPFNELEKRLTFWSNQVGSVCYFVLSFLLLAEVGDVLTVGWKTSRRLWLAFKLVAALLLAAAIALTVTAPWLKPHDVITVAGNLTSAASLLAALAIAAIAVRYHRMGAPAVLLRFGRARLAIDAVGLLVLSCFAFHSIPPDLLAEALAALGLCRNGEVEHLEWVALLHCHWLAEIVPISALLLLAHYLERMKLGSVGFRSSDS